jgi:hypothetical protein
MNLRTKALLAASFALSIHSQAWADVPQIPTPSLDDLQKLVRLETGSTQDLDQTLKLFAPESPWDDNPLTRIFRSLFKTAEALVDVGVPKSESYSQNLLQSVNNSVSSLTGIVGESIDDGMLLYNSEELEHHGYVKNTDVLQCSGDLPLRYLDQMGGILGVSQMKHVWIQAGGTTYGMPYTLQHTYFGGDSMIYSPDEFQSIFANIPDVVCTPVYQPTTVTTQSFDSAVQCITQNVSHFSHHEGAVATFLDYSVFEHNCLSASRFIVECAGGEVAQDPNLGIGGHLSWSYPIKRAQLSQETESLHTQLYYLIGQINAAALKFTAPPETPLPDEAQAQYAEFIAQNSALIEQWRLATVAWLDNRGDQKSKTQFLAQYYLTASDSKSFLRYVTQWGWSGLVKSIGRLENDLTIFDFENGEITTESLGSLCNQVRTSCNLPELNLPQQ